MIAYKNHILSLCRSQNLSSAAPCYQKFQDQNFGDWLTTVDLWNKLREKHMLEFEESLTS